jgi:ATP-dependent helicase HepA
MEEFKPGQRWVSHSEPELGLGLILETDHRTVTCTFSAAETNRRYAKADAPLVRARFHEGDILRTRTGATFEVQDLFEVDDLLFYRYSTPGGAVEVPETELDATLQFSKPQDRLFLNQIDPNEAFNLRYQSLKQAARLAQQPFRGLLGPRTSLLPHQLYIAHQLAQRDAPRALLADEVGLGKTIEAGLVLTQMLQTGRGSRVMILVPEPLKVQWLVEMIRRFNLEFTVLDDARCAAIEDQHRPSGDDPAANNDAGTSGDHAEADDPLSSEQRLPSDAQSSQQPEALPRGAPTNPSALNPFEAQQLVISTLDLFLDHPARLQQALACPWDLIIIDEAHHLQWTQGAPSDAYHAASELAQLARGLLLLSATPEQFGLEGHFGRLQLLDPVRFNSFDDFLLEQARYTELAGMIQTWQADTAASPAARDALAGRLNAPDTLSDGALLHQLLDHYGPAQAMFRNRRAQVLGLTERRVQPAEITSLPAGSEAYDSSGITATDPRLSWLGQLIGNSSDKFLVICHTAAAALTVEKHLRLRLGLKSSCFHEGLDLIARDRSAAYFADPDHGAQVLVCSEIGSEGRNFQFAHQLVMFDLPDQADLIEQRIGRLDRIGQTEPVTIHIPCPENSELARRFAWFHRGLDLFRAPNPAGAEAHQQLHQQFRLATDQTTLEKLISESQQLVTTLQTKLEQGRDLLLEFASFDALDGDRITQALSDAEARKPLSNYLSESFGFFGLELEPLSNQVQLVKPTTLLQTRSTVSAESQGHLQYPEIAEEGIAFTLDRATALAREDIQFLTWEHPLVSQALDRVLSDQIGNACVSLIKRPALPAGTLLVECLYRLDCAAPPHLELQQHLEQPFLRFIIAPGPIDLTPRFDFDPLLDALPAKPEPLAKLIGLQRGQIESMLQFAGTLADAQTMVEIQTAAKTFKARQDTAHDRLAHLARHNPAVSQDAVDQTLEKRAAGVSFLDQVSPRLDAIRVIITA